MLASSVSHQDQHAAGPAQPVTHHADDDVVVAGHRHQPAEEADPDEHVAGQLLAPDQRRAEQVAEADLRQDDDEQDRKENDGQRVDGPQERGVQPGIAPMAAGRRKPRGGRSPRC